MADAQLSSPIGPLPTGWRLARLADIAIKIGSGATPKGGGEVYLPQRQLYALVRSQNVFDRSFDTAGLAFISDEDAAGLRGVELQEGDILLNITGDGVTFGRSCLAPAAIFPAVVNQHVSIVRVDKARVAPGFALAFLTHPSIKHYIESFNAGGSRRAITKGHIESFVLPLPPLPEQRAIARILGALDDKIELNQKTNETLEAMARALFKSWFVDFDPVRAKMAGRRPEEMDAETASLFPAAFAASALGPVPAGWKTTTLGEVCAAGGGEIQTGPFGSQLHASDYVPEGIPSIMPRDLGENRVRTDSIARVREGDAQRLRHHRVRIGDIVYSRRGDVERRALIRLEEEGWLCGTGCLRVRLGDAAEPLFIAATLGTPESRAWVVRHAVGATMPNLNTSILAALPILLPPLPAQRAFSAAVRPADERVTVGLAASRTLAVLRDALLPRLVSGELRVPEAGTVAAGLT